MLRLLEYSVARDEDGGGGSRATLLLCRWLLLFLSSVI